MNAIRMGRMWRMKHQRTKIYTLSPKKEINQASNLTSLRYRTFGPRSIPLSLTRNKPRLQSYIFSPSPPPTPYPPLSTKASSLRLGGTHLLDCHGFTLLIYIVSISSNVLPCVSQTKKYTISTAAKLHPAKTYPYLNPISPTMKVVKNAIRKFHVQFDEVTSAMLRAR